MKKFGIVLITIGSFFALISFLIMTSNIIIGTFSLVLNILLIIAGAFLFRSWDKNEKMKKFGIILMALGGICIIVPLILMIPKFNIITFLFWVIFVSAPLTIFGAVVYNKYNKQEKVGIENENKSVNVVKIIVITFAVLMGLAFVAGSVSRVLYNKKKEELSMSNKSLFYSDVEKCAERYDKKCPIYFPDRAGKITHVKLENQYMVYYAEFDSHFFNIDYWQLPSNNEIFKQGLFYSSFCPIDDEKTNDSINNLRDRCLNSMIKENCGFKYHITVGNRNIDIKITPEEISKMNMIIKYSPSDAYHKIVEQRVLNSKSDLPSYFDYFAYMIDIGLKNNQIIYTILIDENYYDIEAFDDMQMKEDMLNDMIEDKESKDFIILCRKAKIDDMVFLYKGNTTGKVVEWIYSLDSIKDIN